MQLAQFYKEHWFYLFLISSIYYYYQINFTSFWQRQNIHWPQF